MAYVWWEHTHLRVTINSLCNVECRYNIRSGCCLPTPMTLVSGGGVPYSRLWFTSQLLRPYGQQYSHSGGVCPQLQGWQCGAYNNNKHIIL